MQARSAAGEFNGSVLVARHEHIIYERGFGFANLEWKIPNAVNTKFEIGSMTKQFTAVLVLQFVNEGKLRLDGHLSDYLPYYRNDWCERHSGGTSHDSERIMRYAELGPSSLALYSLTESARTPFHR